MNPTEWFTAFQTTFTGLLVLLTLFYVLTTRRQLTAMMEALAETRRSNQATEKNNEIAERGLELGKRAWLVADLKSGSDRSLVIEIQNVGGVPATQVTIWHCSNVWQGANLPDKITPPGEHLPDIGIVIGAGKAYFLATDPLAPNTNEEIAAIESMHAVRFFYCEINYTDTFNKLRKTTACWQFGPDRSGEWDWILAPKHNRLD